MNNTITDANKLKTMLEVSAHHDRPSDTIILTIATKCQVTNRHLTAQSVSVSAGDAKEIIYQLEAAIRSYRAI